jgi:hypothetical protein
MTGREATRKRFGPADDRASACYQERKAGHVRGHDDEVILAMKELSRRVRDLLEGFQPIAPDARVVEVGSGLMD